MIDLQWCLGFSFRFTALFFGAAAILMIGSDDREEKLQDHHPAGDDPVTDRHFYNDHAALRKRRGDPMHSALTLCNF